MYVDFLGFRAGFTWFYPCREGCIHDILPNALPPYRDSLPASAVRRTDTMRMVRLGEPENKTMITQDSPRASPAACSGTRAAFAAQRQGTPRHRPLRGEGSRLGNPW